MGKKLQVRGDQNGGGPPTSTGTGPNVHSGQKTSGSNPALTLRKKGPVSPLCKQTTDLAGREGYSRGGLRAGWEKKRGERGGNIKANHCGGGKCGKLEKKKRTKSP